MNLAVTGVEHRHHTSCGCLRYSTSGISQHVETLPDINIRDIVTANSTWSYDNHTEIAGEQGVPTLCLVIVLPFFVRTSEMSM